MRSPEVGAQVPGHVFVIQGRLEDVTCDAAIIPTDTSFRIERHWLAALGTEGARMPTRWPEERVARFDQNERFWFVDVTDDDEIGSPELALERVETALGKIAESFKSSGSRPVRQRARHLVTLPLIGTSGGGLHPASVVEQQMPLLVEIARSRHIDIAIVVPNRSRYEAIQWQRQKAASSSAKSAARRLGTLAADGELSLMIGAGVSAAAGLPSWSALLDTLSGEVKNDTRKVLATDQFRQMSTWDQAELLQNFLGAEFSSAIVGAIGDKRGDRQRRPSLGHFLLSGLRCGAVATTNYDLLYESAFGSQLAGQFGSVEGGPAVMPYERPEKGQPWILKLHGDVKHSEDIVLSRRSFVGYDSRRRAAGALFQSMLMTSHVLFVGVSMTDDNILRLTHEVTALLPDAPFGTVLGLGPDPVRSELWRNKFEWIGVDAPPAIENRLRGKTQLTPEESQHLLAWQARELEILLDEVALWAVSARSVFLDSTVDRLLADDELTAAEGLRAWDGYQRNRDSAVPASSAEPADQRMPEDMATVLLNDGGRHLSVNESERGLHFSGQDPNREPGVWSEYEYAFEVGRDQIPALRKALEGDETDSVVDLLESQIANLKPGIHTWLRSQGIEVQNFWNRYEY